MASRSSSGSAEDTTTTSGDAVTALFVLTGQKTSGRAVVRLPAVLLIHSNAHLIIIIIIIPNSISPAEITGEVDEVALWKRHAGHSERALTSRRPELVDAPIFCGDHLQRHLQGQQRGG